MTIRPGRTFRAKPVPVEVASTFRVATLNVLGSQHTAGPGGLGPGVDRAAREARLLMDRGADVIGLQEVQVDQLRVFVNQMPGYTVWPQQTLGANSYRLQLVYRTDRFDMIDTQWPQDTIPKIGLDPYTAVVALAHVGHIDDEALKLAMRSDCFYVGALGSKRNHAKRTQRLKDAGFSEAEIARIHSPIGINIGAQSPPEIAISIMAELVLALRGPRVFRPA